jgi:hypothetical protein
MAKELIQLVADARDLSLLHDSWPVVAPTQLPIQWELGHLSTGGKWLGHEAGHSSASSAEVENAWICTSIPPIWLGSLSTGTIFTIYRDGVWGSGGIPPHIFNLGTRCRRAVSFTPRDRAPSTQWIGDWVCLRASLDNVEETDCLAMPGT